MRIESQRTLLLPGSVDEVWRLVSDPSRLMFLAPEIEDAWAVRGGDLRVVARLGRRRRACRVKPTLDEAGHTLQLDSTTPGVTFHLDAQLSPDAAGTSIKVSLRLEPPVGWKADPKPGGVPRRVVQRLLASVVLFALSAFGVVELPSLQLARPAAAVAYAVVGLSFVLAAALLSGAHGPRNRRRLLSRVPGLARDEAAPKS